MITIRSVFRKPVCLVPILAMLVIGLWFYCKYPYHHNVNQLSDDYFEPVRFSSHGKYLLLKNRHANDFNLAIYEPLTGVRTQIHKSERSQISVHFSPDEQRLVFQIRNKNNLFELYLLTISTMKVEKLNAPSSLSGLPPIYWSSNSRVLAYYAVGANDTVLYLHDIIAKTPPRILARGVTLDSVLAWSPDGNELLLYSGIVGSDLIRLSMSGDILKYYPQLQKSAINAISWSKPREALVTARPIEAEFFQLHRLDLESGTSETIVSEVGDITSPMVISQDDSILYHRSYRGVTEVKVFDRKSSQIRTVTNSQEGSTSVNTVLDNGHNLLGIFHSFIEPPIGVKIDLGGGSREVVYEDTSTLDLSISPPSAVSLVSAGKPYDAYLWEPDKERNLGKVLIAVHGGPATYIGPLWNREYSFLLNEGWTIMAPNYHGSSGVGASFSNASDLETQVTEVVATINYLNERYLGKSRIYILGQSYGSRLVIEALREIGDKIEGVILTSTIVGSSIKLPCEKIPSSIVSFIGEEDYLNTPVKVNSYLSEVIGAEYFISNVMPAEGHILRRASSFDSVRQVLSNINNLQTSKRNCEI